MDVVILLVFISLLLVTAGLVFFIYRLREGDFEHGERLALAPLNDGNVIPSEPQENGGEEPVTQQPNTLETERR